MTQAGAARNSEISDVLPFPSEKSAAATGSAEGAIIAEWPLNKREMLRVSIDKWKGLDLINIRKWFWNEDDELRPGKGGIVLKPKHLPALAEAVANAVAVARGRGLLQHPDGPASGSRGA
jgi:hypothetical protein